MADAQIANLQSKLAEHRSQLAQVEQLLLLKHDDEVLLKLKEDLVQVISLTEELTSTRIAKSKPAEPAADAQDDKFKVGERVSAKFTDGKWYTARVNVVNEYTKSYLVTFLDYGDSSEVSFDNVRAFKPLQADQISIGQAVRAIFTGDGLYYDAVINENLGHAVYKVTFTQYGDEAEVPLRDLELPKNSKKRLLADEADLPDQMEVPEYLRAKTTDSEEQKASKRRRLRAMKSNFRQLKQESELNKRQQTWQQFSKKASGSAAPAGKKAKVAAPLPGVRAAGASSIFASPDSIDGKVGVTNSGKAPTEFHHLRDYSDLKKGASAGDE